MIPTELTLVDYHYMSCYAYGYTGTTLPSTWISLTPFSAEGYVDGVGDRAGGVLLPLADFNCSYHCKRPPGTYISSIFDPINPVHSVSKKIYVVGLWVGGAVSQQWILCSNPAITWEPVDIPF